MTKRKERFKPEQWQLALSASDRACYDFPGDTDVAREQRAAFIAGALWAQSASDGEAEPKR